MKKTNRKKRIASVCLLASFALWTAAVCFVDVQPIGPQGTSVGLASWNSFFHTLTGVHMALYTLTDWLSLIPLGFAAGFTLLGLVQWIWRKRLLLVDRSLLVLGCFYLVVMALYVFFEIVPVNYRPVLINGSLEVSYPSSTTMLVLCIMPTALLQLHSRIRSRLWRHCAAVGIPAFTAFMVLGRLLSGVHWLTDIIGGALVSTGLVLLYAVFSHSDPK